MYKITTYIVVNLLCSDILHGDKMKININEMRYSINIGYSQMGKTILKNIKIIMQYMLIQIQIIRLLYRE